MGDVYYITIRQVIITIHSKISRIDKKTRNLCDVNIFFILRKDLQMCHLCKTGGGIICTLL